MKWLENEDLRAYPGGHISVQFESHLDLQYHMQIYKIHQAIL